MNYSVETLNLMDPIDVYELRLKEVITKFPKGFFSEGDEVNKDVGIKLLRYLLEQKLKFSDSEIKENFSIKLIKKHKLYGMLKKVFNDSPYDAINSLYPGKFKPWDFKHSPNHYWNDKTGVDATIWLLEEKLKWDDEQIKEKLSSYTFQENSLQGMLSVVYGNSPYKAVNAAYPGKFKPWELSCTNLNFWNDQNAIIATKWLIEEKLKLTDEQIKTEVGKKMFKENGLGAMLRMVYGSSSYKALNAAYPGKFKPWELKCLPKNFWNEENGKEALIWVVEEKLKLTDEQLLEVYGINFLKENNIYGMVRMVYDGSPYKALNATYPGKFKPWELKYVPRNYWNKDNSKKAIKWLIEDKLKFSDDEICQKVILELFQKYGLVGMVHSLYGGSCFEAINEVYPGKFKRALNGTIKKIN